MYTTLQTWTTQQLINLSANLANVYGTPINATKAEDAWTAQNFIGLSDVLAQAYGPGIK